MLAGELSIMQKKIEPIKTSRLRLESLSVQCLQALSNEDMELARDLVSFEITVGTSLIGKPWVSRRLKMITEDASQHPWIYRAIVREDSNEMVGYISFHHGFPDPDLVQYSENGVELGYEVEPEYRRRGYASESVIGMVKWAREQQKAVEVFVSISPTNEPSIRLAKSLNFTKVGERYDDIDGLEYVLKFQPNEESNESARATSEIAPR